MRTIFALLLGLVVCLISNSVNAYYPGSPTYSVSCSLCWSATITLTASTTSTAVQSAAPTSGLFAYVTHISCWNTGSTATTVVLQNGSGGTTIYEANVPATTGGFIDQSGTPLTGGDTTLGNGMTVATAVFIKAGSSTSSLICNVAGYNAP